MYLYVYGVDSVYGVWGWRLAACDTYASRIIASCKGGGIAASPWCWSLLDRCTLQYCMHTKTRAY